MDTEESNASSPHLTVVIPTYNMGDMVGEAIKSVLRQTYADLELIVVDDGSTDDTQERLHAIDDPRMRVIALERRGGTAAAMNVAIEEARGRYLAFLDADDVWLPDKMELQIERIAAVSDQGWDGAYCGSRILTVDGRSVERKATVEGDLRSDLLSLSIELGGNSTLVMRKDHLDDLGGFDETFARHTDYDMVIRYCGVSGFAAVEEAMVIKHGFNIPEGDLYAEVKERFLSKFEDDISSFGPERAGHIRSAHWLDVAYVNLAQHKTVEGMRYMIRALSHEPVKPPKKYFEMGGFLLISVLRVDINRLIGKLMPTSSLQY